MKNTSKNHKIKLYYYLDSPESEVFRFLKEQNAMSDLPITMANFYLPHARLSQKANHITEQFEESLSSFISLTNAHLESQKKDLLQLENLHQSSLKKTQMEHLRTSISINFSFRSLSTIDEVLRYLLTLSPQEVNEKIKKFAVSWYLFTARCQLKKYYPYTELKFTYDRGKNWILNETKYLKNFVTTSPELCDVVEKNNSVIPEVIEVIDDRSTVNKKDLFF